MAEPGFTIEEFTAGDGYRWRYRHFPAQGEQRGQIVGIHGIQSHGGWYEGSCRQLSQAGFSVCFLDRRGSGLNEKDRGDAPSFRRLLDDISEFLATRSRVAERGARIPLCLLAISWGGKLAVALERRHPGLVDGLVLLCPGFFARVRYRLLQRLAILTSRLCRPRRLFSIPLNDPELFTTTPQWLQFLRDDPLRLHQATARLLIESVRLDSYLRFAPRYVRVPVLLMLAQRDRIIDNARTRRFVERFASTDREIIEYPDAHHTLEFEPAPLFVDDLQGWLNRHLG